MKSIILNIVIIILKIVYMPIKLFKIQDKIVYISRQSNEEPLDFKLIREQMQERYPKYKNVILAKKIEAGIIKKIGYAFHMLVQMYHISTAKVVILDSYCIVASVLKHKKQTKIIQIWHALGAIKKFGYQTIGKEAGTDEIIAKIMCMHKNYNYVLTPSEVTAEHYKEAFNITDKQIKYIGMPRIDYILNKDESIKNKIYDKYPELNDKINILYVPTFRKGEKIELDDLVQKLDVKKYNLIIKLHPLDTLTEQIEKEGVIYEKEFKTYDLLKIANKVITDYSSLAIEAALLDIDIYFYTYDIEKYKQSPGLNLDFNKEEIGNNQVINIDELLEKIERKCNSKILEQFRNKYVTVNQQQCTKQLVNFIMEELNNEN